VLGEFRYGIAGSRHCAAYESWLATHLAQFEVLAMTQEATITYAALRVAVKRLGRPIPANDASIAALALQLGMPILSRDEHLDVVPDLARKTW
jgi:predicted nucleic acid-binding protein